MLSHVSLTFAVRLTSATHYTSSQLRLVLIVLAIIILQTSSSSVCYTIAGTQTDDLACHPDQPNSMCCQANDICLSNGLCQPSNDTGIYTQYYFLGCTDPTWSAPECYTQCQNSSGDGVLGCSPGNFCCYGTNNSGCCENSTDVFHLGIGTVVTVLGTSTSISSNGSATIAATASTTSNSPATVTIIQLPSSPAAPTTTSAPISSTPNIGVAIGMGLGMGLPVSAAVLAGLYYFLVIRPKRQHRESRISSMLNPAHETISRNKPVGKDNARELGAHGIAHELRAFEGTELATE